jgi:hypothetical protein
MGAFSHPLTILYLTFISSPLQLITLPSQLPRDNQHAFISLKIAPLTLGSSNHML